MMIAMEMIGENIMRKYMTGAMIVACAFLLLGCNIKSETASIGEVVQIELSDAEITVNGEHVSEQKSESIYIAKDILTYNKKDAN